MALRRLPQSKLAVGVPNLYGNIGGSAPAAPSAPVPTLLQGLANLQGSPYMPNAGGVGGSVGATTAEAQAQAAYAAPILIQPGQFAWSKAPTAPSAILSVGGSAPASGSSSGIPIAAPTYPTLSLSTAHQVIAQQATSPAAAQYVAGTLGSAAAGHPTAIANAEVLNLAQRLQIQAQYVAKYLGQSQAAAIAKGLHLTTPMQIPLGTGKYDPLLPLYLEQTVDAMIAGNQDPSQLAQLSAALYQAPSA